MAERSSWRDVRRGIIDTPEARDAYDEARLRFELGRVVRERRVALGLTQEQLGGRADMQQPSVARFEAGGTMPTIPVLERPANALGLRLTIQLEPPQGAG